MRIEDIKVGDKLTIIGNGNHPEGAPYHFFRTGLSVEAVALYPANSELPNGYSVPVDVVYVRAEPGGGAEQLIEVHDLSNLDQLLH